MADDGRNILEIDIATRIVGDEEDMYVVRPGVSYSLYDDFEREDAVFLDFPDLPFSLDQKPRFTDTAREIVSRSLAIREWHLDPDLPEPSRDQADYKGAAVGRRVGAYIGAIQRLYYELPVGTIMLVPSSKSYIDDVKFAEIVGPTERRKAAKAYPDEDMMVRPVRWLASKQKAALSPDLRSALGQPTPVMQLPRSLRGEVLKVAYKQYVFQGLNSTRITTTAHDFNIVDDLNIQLFNNYVAGLLAALEEGLSSKATIHTHEALKFLRKHKELVPELDQNISSPGFQRLYGGHIAPLVIGALMTVALSSEAFGQSTQVRVKNSAMLAGDPCAVQVQEHIRESMGVAHFGEFLEMCAALKETKKDTGLSTSMDVRTKKFKLKKAAR